MRCRSIGPFGCQVESLISASYTPLTVSLAQAVYWYWRVKTWRLQVHIETDPGGVLIADGDELIQWNYNSMNGGGGPTDEKALPSGAQMNQLLVTLTSGSSPFAGVDFFSTFLNSAADPYSGVIFDSSSAIPLLRITVDSLTTTNDPVAGNGVVVTLDGYDLNFSGSLHTGFISMDPYEWWEYRREDGTNPMYDSASSTILLGRQTDELP